MSFTVENLEEKNMVKLVIESTAEEFEAGLNTAYNKNKSKISLPGFRKGKAPRKMIEKMYGAEVFYEDAANSIIPDAYAKAADECGLELVSQPKINVTQLEAGKPFIFEAVVATKPEVELGQYKGVEVTKADTEATDADVEEELKRVQEQNSRTVAVTDRAVKDGDNTVIDFEGFVDGVAFEGGKGTDYPLTIGSHSFRVEGGDAVTCSEGDEVAGGMHGGPQHVFTGGESVAIDVPDKLSVLLVILPDAHGGAYPQVALMVFDDAAHLLSLQNFGVRESKGLVVLSVEKIESFSSAEAFSLR